MSVLIKNMEMPESCYRCPMANDDFYLCADQIGVHSSKSKQ